MQSYIVIDTHRNMQGKTQRRDIRQPSSSRYRLSNSHNRQKIEDTRKIKMKFKSGLALLKDPKVLRILSIM